MTNTSLQPDAQSQNIRVVGRYMLHAPIASGGMATVHLARLLGPVGFSRTVAIKRLHPQYASDPNFASMFIDEARLVARIRHPNVVQTLDVVAQGNEIYLVMDYVLGESLWRLIRTARQRGAKIAPKIVATIMAGVLNGLHAAHEAKGEHGETLGIVHRDVSPQNVLVGSDGVARVLDFGVAKAVGCLHQTQAGQIKGKLAYMAPEQLHGIATRATDIYSASVVLWEALTGERLFGSNDAGLINRLLVRNIKQPSEIAPELSKDVDVVVMRGLEGDPANRYRTAREMARAVEGVIGTVPLSEVGEWVESMAKDTLADRTRRIAEIESISSETIRIEAARGQVGTDSNSFGRFGEGEAKSGEVSRPIEERISSSDGLGVRLGGYAAPSNIEANQGAGPSIPVTHSSWAPARTENRSRAIGIGVGVALLSLGAVLAVGARWRARSTQIATREAPAQTISPASSVAPAEGAGTPVVAAPAAPSASERFVVPTVAWSPPAASETPPPSSGARRPIMATRRETSNAGASRPIPPTPAPASTGASTPSTSAKPSTNPAGCAVPFTVGADGIRYPKVECL